MTKINKAEFIKSSAGVSECPPENNPEFAFIGRSNVGKSSLINMITGRSKLARISSTPGKTQLINHFLINKSWYIVDLPGYGYARLSKKQRKGFSELIEKYIITRKNLINLFVLIDANIPPQKSDLEFTEWLGVNEIPFSVVYTKTDRPSQKKLSENLENFRQEMLKTWTELPPEFLSSAVKKRGRNEILKYIGECIAQQ